VTDSTTTRRSLVAQVAEIRVEVDAMHGLAVRLGYHGHHGIEDAARSQPHVEAEREQLRRAVRRARELLDEIEQAERATR